jgi:hypothetical protein
MIYENCLILFENLTHGKHYEVGDEKAKKQIKYYD